MAALGKNLRTCPSRTLLGNEQTAYVEDNTWGGFRDIQMGNARVTIEGKIEWQTNTLLRLFYY